MASLKYQNHYLHQEQEDKYQQEEVNEELFGHEVGLFLSKERKIKKKDCKRNTIRNEIVRSRSWACDSTPHWKFNTLS